MTATTLDHQRPPHRPDSTPRSLREALPALVALSLVMLVEMVDNSVLNVALPTIGRDLHAGPTGLQWVVGAYSLTFGGLLLVGGSLGDRYGRRRVLLVGLVGFGLAGLLTLVVHTTAQLVAVRAVSGAFAALVAPGTMSLGMRLFTDEDLRRRAIGVIVTVAMIGFAVGPVAAGLAVTHLPWQALLVVNAPIAVLAIWGVRRGIPADDPADLRRSGADVPGAVASVGALGLTLYGCTRGAEDGWGAASTLGCLAAGVTFLVAFVWRERTAREPMLDLSLLARPTVRGSAVLQTSVMVALVGVGFASTQLFQYAWGWTALTAGLAQLPLIAGMILATPLVDRIIATTGHRRSAAIGTGLLVGSLIELVIGVGQGYVAVAVGMFVMTFAMRLVMTTCSVELIEALPSDHTSLGSALNDTAQEIGNAVGVAVVGTIVATVLGGTLPDHAWPADVTDHFVGALRVAFVVLAAVVALMGALGVRTLSDSTTLEEH